jgi:hypothetical protein
MNGSTARRFARSSVTRKDKEVIDFFVAFSRFEFALKECRFICRGEDAKPDWDCFARHLDATTGDLYTLCPALRAEIDELVAAPPMVQVHDDGVLRWVDRNLRDASNLTLTRYLRRIRNNLFHGAKESLTCRDRWFVHIGLDIIDQLLEMNEDVRREFLRSLPTED